MQPTSSSKPTRLTLFWARLWNVWLFAVSSPCALTLVRWIPFTG
jgi:hypothetical protein